MNKQEKNKLEKQLKGTADENNHIDFSNLDFTGYTFNASGLKADNIDNGRQESEGFIVNKRQKSKKWISNTHQESEKWVNNNDQRSSAIYNDNQVITSKEMTIEEMQNYISEKEGVTIKLKQ